jgi:hypothetical protein
MSLALLGVHFRAKQILDEKTAEANGSLGTLKTSLKLLDTQTGILPQEATTPDLGEYVISKHLYRFLCVITLSGYHIFTRSRIDSLFNQADSWLNRACDSIENTKRSEAGKIISKAAANVQESLEDICGQLFEAFSSVPVEIHYFSGEIISAKTPYELLEKCITPDFGEYFQKNPMAWAELDNDHMKMLFPARLDPQPENVLTLKQSAGDNEELRRKFYVKAAQLSQMKKRDSSFAADLELHWEQIIATPFLRDCFNDFQATFNEELEKDPLCKIFSSFNYTAGDFAIMDFHRRIFAGIFEDFCNSPIRENATFADRLSSLSDQFSAKDLCTGNGPHTIDMLAWQLPVFFEKLYPQWLITR